ncbi:unnamed protein product, partial [Discosporangium mesarthrocarpum]
MTVSRDGLRPSPTKVLAVTVLAPPRTEDALRAFLGMICYLREFVKDYSTIAAPLIDLLFDASYSRRTRFLGLPADASVHVVERQSSHPRGTSFTEFALHTDASSEGAGVVRNQVLGDDRERVFANASHPWSRSDSRRSATERQCMTVL